MIKDLVLATSNKHKVAEILSIFTDANIQINLVTLDQIENPPSVEEDAPTFAGNALKKARELSRYCKIPAIADDSGLVVDALEGQPGVLSARWAGVHGDDQANLNLVLDQMKDVEAELRMAKFVCAAAMALPDGREFVTAGEIEGSLTLSPRGKNGFGYDSIFVPTGYEITTAEMDPQLKNSISHRAVAFRKLAIMLAALD
jgi:XTP/dITP diphosphohydrolase